MWLWTICTTQPGLVQKQCDSKQTAARELDHFPALPYWLTSVFRQSCLKAAAAQCNWETRWNGGKGLTKSLRSLWCLNDCLPSAIPFLSSHLFGRSCLSQFTAPSVSSNEMSFLFHSCIHCSPKGRVGTLNAINIERNANTSQNKENRRCSVPFSFSSRSEQVFQRADLNW